MKVNVLMLRLAKWMLGHYKVEGQKELPPQDPALIKTDIAPFEGAEKQQRYDIHYAEKPNGITIIEIHGGAYIFSNRKNNAYYARFFANSGFNVVSLDYRLNHGHIAVHDQIRDLACEIKHLYEHAEEFGLDPHKFVLTGDSAGGHFALIIAAAMDDEQVRKNLQLDFGGCHVLAVAANSPLYDLVAVGQSNIMTKRAKKYMMGTYAFDMKMQALASVKGNIDNLKMPLFLSTCKKDFIREETMNLKAYLESRNYPFTFVDIEDESVGHVHNVVSPDFEPSKKVNNAMISFFEGVVNK